MKEKLTIRILYNNLGQAESCETAWGFSAMIETDEKNVLFDTGGDPQILEKNMQSFNIHPDEIDHIVISHEHWDHVNGLKFLAGKIRKDCPVYVPEGAEGNISYLANFSEVKSTKQALQIEKNIWLSGTMDVEDRDLVEQALIVDYRNKLYVITGCSHPGIADIVRQVTELFPEKKIALVTGGFHIRDKSQSEILEISNSLREMGVEKLAPSHCSGELAIKIFRKEWGRDFIELYVADELAID